MQVKAFYLQWPRFIHPGAIGLYEWTGLFYGWPNMALECLSAQWQSLRAPKTLGDEMERELVKCPVLRSTQSFGCAEASALLAIQLLAMHCVLVPATTVQYRSLSIVQCAGNLEIVHYCDKNLHSEWHQPEVDWGKPVCINMTEMLDWDD